MMGRAPTKCGVRKAYKFFGRVVRCQMPKDHSGDEKHRMDISRNLMITWTDEQCAPVEPERAAGAQVSETA